MNNSKLYLQNESYFYTSDEYGFIKRKDQIDYPEDPLILQKWMEKDLINSSKKDCNSLIKIV